MSPEEIQTEFIDLDKSINNYKQVAKEDHFWIVEFFRLWQKVDDFAKTGQKESAQQLYDKLKSKKPPPPVEYFKHIDNEEITYSKFRGVVYKPFACHYILHDYWKFQLDVCMMLYPDKDYIWKPIYKHLQSKKDYIKSGKP